MKIWILDAFTHKPYTGNPAAVTLVNEFPSDSNCQDIATEMNLSETAFVKLLSHDHFHIRWFTPSTEVKLCGHATLAASHVLFQEKIALSDNITLTSLSGPLAVYKNHHAYTLDFPLQTTGPALPIKEFQELLQTEVISAVQAMDDIIVELPHAAAIRNFTPNFEKINVLDCRGLIITAQAQDDYDFISRFFAPRVGVPEDPVTGSAHCKLADYWQKKLRKTQFSAYQASKRGGELKITIHDDRVHLTGKVTPIMQGE